ncbi:class I tRNA ligase family protein [Candidatus Wolfebacteria bacterium]|nr:class I tRNA ligase family protein [Candidatus Wolfebacteria bacterium]
MDKFLKPYNPKEVEEKIYKLWEKSGFFDPDNLPVSKIRNSKLGIRNFSIIMPPPNANGVPHLGHALFVTLEDIMIRYKRMRGFKTLWLPGADHAGFETQVVYEKKLEKEGRSRFKLSSEQLWQEIWDFVQTNKGATEEGLRRLGASCDWSRNKFTLDPDIVKKTQETFIQMYEDGLVYRGERLVNWCVKHQTGLSELEVKHEEKTDSLYYIKYGPLVVATVRPETIFGDTAVAVNPKDTRYKKLIGKEIEVDMVVGKVKLKVIADKIVDPNFGTGAVKVIRKYYYFNDNERVKKIQGLKVLEARKVITEELSKRGLLKKVEEYKHDISLCYKCGHALEPRLMSQWFIRMTEAQKNKKSLRDLAVHAVKSGKIKFIPKRSEKIFFHWMKNIRDWNISRQIVWGIKIPAWFCLGCDDVKFNPEIKSQWFLVRHGETDYNAEKRWQGHMEIPLNETGKKQAREAVLKLKNKKIDLIISSDLTRCRQTAEIIANELKVEIIFDEGLRERHMGAAQGLTIDEYDKIFGQNSTSEWRKNYNSRPDGGETFRELEDRVLAAFNRHKSKHKHKNIVVVTHGGPIRMINKSIKNISFEESLKNPHPQNAEVIELTISKEKCKKCGGDLVKEDPDVFDTWFSSGQWPFLTLGYGETKKQKSLKAKSDYETFYPTDVMETGWDILFFWVARMIMLGIYKTGKIPFKYVYLHGLVRDKDKQKMSKSKGNVVDPLGLINEYGADALRMTLIVGNTPGNDPTFSEEKVRGYRNFANKVWQASRFVLAQAANSKFENQNKKLTVNDRKRLKEFDALKKKITEQMESFKFYLAAEEIYHYFWHVFCDKIIEENKNRLKPETMKSAEDKAAANYVLLYILDGSLKLLHPFMPFITEEIYQNLPLRQSSGQAGNKGKFLMVEEWPINSKLKNQKSK